MPFDESSNAKKNYMSDNMRFRQFKKANSSEDNSLLKNAAINKSKGVNEP